MTFGPATPTRSSGTSVPGQRRLKTRYPIRCGTARSTSATRPKSLRTSAMRPSERTPDELCGCRTARQEPDRRSLCEIRIRTRPEGLAGIAHLFHGRAGVRPSRRPHRGCRRDRRTRPRSTRAARCLPPPAWQHRRRRRRRRRHVHLLLPGPARPRGNPGRGYLLHRRKLRRPAGQDTARLADRRTGTGLPVARRQSRRGGAMTVSGVPRIIVANGSLRTGGFRERVLAASDADFDGFGMHVRDYANLRSAGWTDADLRAVLRDNGFDLIEIETVLGWDDPPDSREEDGLRREQLAFELADAVGARHVVAVGALTGEARDTAAEGFAGLCDRAADHGLLVAVEPQACSTITDLQSAVAIVRTAARPNGGLNLDIWHATRGAWPRAELAALNRDEIVVAQIDDGPLTPVTTDYLAECTHYRMTPGEGEFDSAGISRSHLGRAGRAARADGGRTARHGDPPCPFRDGLTWISARCSRRRRSGRTQP